MSEPLNPIGRVAGYRELTEEDFADMNELKALYQAVIDKLDEMAAANGQPIPGESPGKYDGRCIAVAKTETQTASMWAVRAITKPEGP